MKSIESSQVVGLDFRDDPVYKKNKDAALHFLENGMFVEEDFAKAVEEVGKKNGIQVERVHELLDGSKPTSSSLVGLKIGLSTYEDYEQFMKNVRKFRAGKPVVKMKRR